MIAASVLEYIFITVTCCKEIAKKLFQHFLQLFTHDVQFLCIFCGMHTHHCLANSTTFQDLALRFPGLPRTKLIFQDFPGPGNFTNTIPGLSRCGNPAASTWSKQSKTISNQLQQLTCHMGSHSAIRQTWHSCLYPSKDAVLDLATSEGRKAELT